MSINWKERYEAQVLRVDNFVDGRRLPIGGTGLDKVSPRDGRLLYRFNSGDSGDVEHAVASARRAFDDGRWSRLPLHRRKGVLLRLAALVEDHREELALLECLDVGKPIAEAIGMDIPAVLGVLRHSAEAIESVSGKVYAVDGSSLSYESRRPFGVVAGIVGWNFPLALAARKIGPALVTGNCLVLKPSEITSLSTVRLAELALAAGVPEGVFNVIHGGAETGATLSGHRDVDMLTFTGSSATGKRLMVASGNSNMKPLLLECGGKAPSIIFDDVGDLDAVADNVLARAFRNQGQVCTASSRVLIHEGIKTAFLDLLTKKAEALALGDPLEGGTKFGALASAAHRRKVLDYIERGVRDGAEMIFQGRNDPPFVEGHYVPVTIFDKVLPDHAIATEEIFGPVLSVLSFREDDEAVRLANATPYGLSATIWTRDFARAHHMTQSIDAGLIIVSTGDRSQGGPSGGVLAIGGHKESGIGVEGGLEGLEAYTRQSAVQLFV
jgi:acyl-CoA reductase-like NAD-dependent aldehyde dehydrogenase